MKIAVLDDYQNVAFELADWSVLGSDVTLESFSDHQSEESEIVARLQDFDAVVLMRERTPFPRSLIEKLPRLRLIVTSGMRNAAIDLEAAGDHGIAVSGTTYAGNPLSYSTAELAWALILGLARDIPRQDASMRAGGWQIGLGRQLQGLTLGVLGLGRLGTQVAAVGRAFGMEVIAWSQNLTAERAEAGGATLAASKEALLAAADVVTIHLVLSARTRGLVDAAALAAMKPDAYLVNTSRAPIVDTNALIEALESGRIAGAAIDVYDIEPLPADHRLRRVPNTVLTPHIGYVTREQYRVYYEQMVEDIAAFMAGAPIRLLNEPGKA